MPILIRGSDGKVQKIQEGYAEATNKKTTDTTTKNDYKKIVFPFLGNLRFYVSDMSDLLSNTDVVIAGCSVSTKSVSVSVMSRMASFHDNNPFISSVSFTIGGTSLWNATISNGYLTLEVSDDSGQYFANEYRYVTWSD